jgi:hypothetical protein
MTEEGLLRSMTEAELQRWIRYAGRHQLPLRRLELMIAQLSTVVARSFGAKDAKVSDFMLREPDDETTNETPIEAMKKAFAFRPRPKLKVVA